MSITNGQTAEAGDFINNSEKNVNPALNAGKVPKLESDGKVHRDFLSAKSALVEASNANPSINTDLYNRYILSALALDVASFTTNLSGTPQEGDELEIKITAGSANPASTLVEKAFYDTDGSTSSAVINKPTGTAEGDIMFAWIMMSTTGMTITSIPSGWTQLAIQNSNNGTRVLLYRVAGASEGASYTFGFNTSSTYVSGAIFTYRGGFDTSNPINTYSNTQYMVTNTTCRGASITTTLANCNAFWFGNIYDGGAISFSTPSGWTEDYDGQFGGSGQGMSGAVNRKQLGGAGATGDIDSTMSQNRDGKHAFVVALNPVQKRNLTWGAKFTTVGDYYLPSFVLAGTTKIIPFVYNAVTALWESRLSFQKFVSGITTYDVATASGTKVIPHALGEIPKRIKITGLLVNGTTGFSQAIGVFDSSGNKCAYVIQNEGTSTAVADIVGSSTVYSILLAIASTSAMQTGIITVDANNITITFTKTGSPTGTAQILWEAEL